MSEKVATHFSPWRKFRYFVPPLLPCVNSLLHLGFGSAMLLQVGSIKRLSRLRAHVWGLHAANLPLWNLDWLVSPYTCHGLMRSFLLSHFLVWCPHHLDCKIMDTWTVKLLYFQSRWHEDPRTSTYSVLSKRKHLGPSLLAVISQHEFVLVQNYHLHFHNSHQGRL